MTEIVRETSETRVSVTLDASPTAASVDTATTDPFLDHMLTVLGRYAGFGLTVEARGDLPHHLIEDVAITLGVALHDETPEACTRYADATVVMDEAMVQVALDLGGRSYYEGPLPSSLYDHFLRSLAENARMTLHVRVLRGTDRHHVVEAAFKALGLALAKAVAPGDAVFSTKGSVKLERRRLA
ncbi:MAG: imidazoleglycerol-phosphate dehydratase [Deinococcales bacterium]|nr:imidazoleglycerol-phosphate dehydratase [Deinococcales bacterium]